MSSIEAIIKQLYHKHKKSYLSSYGGDVAISLVLLYLFSLSITYFYVLNHIPELQKKWPKEKCNPLYMPFAGLVLKNSNKTNLQAISDNFNGCIQNILESVAQDALAPLYYAKQVAIDTTKEAGQANQSIRSFFNNIRTDIQNTSENISGRTLNIMMPPTQWFIYLKDFFARMQGIYTASTYTMFGGYLTLRASMLYLLHTIVVVILVALCVSIAAMLFIPFVGWALAAPVIALFMAIMIPTIPIIIQVNRSFAADQTTDMPHW
tara:strand:+ start:497 stop:1288 length:792 start_codon:yes stop_codon:yes gene_type:complete